MRNKTPDKKIAPLIIVSIDISCDIMRFSRKKIIEMVQKTARQFKIKKARINFAVLDDLQTKKLNREFLKKSSTTDVISFNLSDKKDDLNIFDIAVNAEMANRQAKIRGNKPQAELALYFLHGLLHNLGFDDLTANKAAKMHKTEDEILQKFGYGVVYKSKK